MVRTSRPLVERMTLVWHDWFATSNAGVGSQKLMLAQNRLLRRNALGRFDHLLVAITANPAMLLWLSGADNRKGAPNENYGRELMELFTLGEGNGYTRAGRPRAGARADRLDEHVEARQGPDQLPLRRRSATTRARRRSSASGARSRGATRSQLCLHHPTAPAVLRHEALELLRSRAARRRHTRGRSSELYRTSGYEVRPVLDAILRHPALYTGPRMVKPPVVYIAGLLRGLGRGVDTAAWVWLAEGAGQRLFYPPNVAGWDDTRWLDTNTFRGRWAIANEALEKVALEQKKGQKPPKVPNDPEAIVKGALAVLGNPTIRPETHAELLAFAARLAASGATGWKAEPIPRSSRTPSASCSPCPPTCRPADGAAAPSIRARASSAGARRGRARPARDRAGHADAGGHRPRPADVPRPRARARARRLRRRGAAAAGLRGGDRGRSGRQRRSGKVLVSVFLDGGADALSLLYPGLDPLYRQLRPRLALAPGAGTPFAEDPSLSWHPSLAPLAQLHGEGKVTVMPGDRLRPPEPVALHLAALLGGRRSRRAARDRLARALPRPGRSTDNPLQGLSLDWSLQPSLATAKMPVAAVDAPDRYDFWTRGVWGEVDERMVDDDRAARRAPDPRRRRPRGRPPMRPASRRGCTEQLAPFRPKDDTKPLHEPRRLSRTVDDSFPRRLAGLAAMLAAGLPLRVVALSAPGGYDTHDDQANDLADGLKLTADSLLAFQRDLEARGLADRVLVHVWSEFGRRAKENGSGGTDHGAAGTGFLIGSRVTGHDDRRVPRARRGSTRTATSARRPTSAGSTRRCSRTGSEPTPSAIIPGARKFRAARDPAMRRVLAAALGRRSRSRSARALRHAREVPTRVQVVADEFTLTLSRTKVRRRRRDRRARQLRRGRPRSRSPPYRRHADLPHRASSIPADGRARPEPARRAATRSGARSPTTAPAGCGRRCTSAERGE